jgi:hypothetical protein
MIAADLPVMRRLAARLALIEGKRLVDVLTGMVARATRADGSRPRGVVWLRLSRGRRRAREDAP